MVRIYPCVAQVTASPFHKFLTAGWVILGAVEGSE